MGTKPGNPLAASNLRDVGAADGELELLRFAGAHGRPQRRAQLASGCSTDRQRQPELELAPGPTLFRSSSCLTLL